MFKNPSFLFDIICTAAWIILVVRYARKGFLSSIVQLVGNLFSLLGAKELSAACAGEDEKRTVYVEYSLLLHSVEV